MSPTLRPTRLLARLATAGLLTLACTAEPDTPSDDACTSPRSPAVDLSYDLDVLLVLENSPTTVREQAALTDALRVLIDRLEGADVNYRIAITRADRGDPRDLAGEVPGGLVLRSCREQLSEFVADGVDATALCTDRCALSPEALEFAPSPARDGTEAPRLWLERLYGGTNLEADSSIADALACYVPQGIAASSFASPLEGMYQALASAEGRLFVRPDADLLVIVLTDGYDCSFDPTHVEVFAESSVFWSDPEASEATPAACWHAGVACPGEADDLGACAAIDRGVDGLPAAGSDDAVLFPVARYDLALAELLADKRSVREDAQVLVAGFAGVPAGFPEVDVTYAEAADPEERSEHAVAPGCGLVFSGEPVPGEEARPPVRLRELAEAFPLGAQPGLRSICESSYGPAFDALADDVIPEMPSCINGCLVDQDPSTALLEPDCEFVRATAESQVPVPHCTMTDGAPTVPEGATECVILRVDPGGESETPADDMTRRGGVAVCAALDSDLEIAVIGAPGSDGVLRGECAELPANACDCP